MSFIETILTMYFCILFSGAYFGGKAKSKISVIMGISSGLMVLLGMVLIRYNTHAGYYFLSVLSGLLSIVFLIRLIKTQKFMPAGMLLGASCVVLLSTISQLSQF